MEIFAKIRESKICTNFILPNVHPAKISGRSSSVRSLGMGHVKAQADNKELQSIYKNLGVDVNKNPLLFTPEDSAIMVMAKLANTYENEIKGRTFVDREGNPMSDDLALYYAYTGNKKNKVGNNTYQFTSEFPKRNYEQVKNYGNQFDIQVFDGNQMTDGGLLNNTYGLDMPTAWLK